MSIPFKKVERGNPMDPKAASRYYIQLVTMGQATLETIAYEMKESSSLSLGDIKSVLTNFVTAMRRSLYNGHSVNISGFGVFNLSAHCEGRSTLDLCTVKDIKSVRITFRAASNVRPNPTSRVTGEQMNFVDLDKMMEDRRAEEDASQE
ncbi:HU family DNA-binding protein [Phocaeicola sp.]